MRRRSWWRNKKEKLYNFIALLSPLNDRYDYVPSVFDELWPGNVGSGPDDDTDISQWRPGGPGEQGRRSRKEFILSLSPAWRSVTPAMVLRCLHSARCHPQPSTLSLNYDQDELNLSCRWQVVALLSEVTLRPWVFQKSHGFTKLVHLMFGFSVCDLWGRCGQCGGTEAVK